MKPALSQSSCANHPDRPGRALCMSCKKVVCQECATQWDGINYCVRCLAARRKATDAGSSWGAWIATVLVCLLLFLLAPALMVWVGALLGRLA